ncbi:MAG: response regulator [Campylobacterales bacterium]|nr:response regulator [Campylobacterales bacterium]
MKVLVVENEHYLAQSIISKLSNLNYICESATTKEEAFEHREIDVLVLSTNISEQNFQPIIEKFRNSIIILLVSYVNNDTVGEPLKNGADDFLVKPIMIEHLIKKIEHYTLFNRLEKESKSVKNYIKNSLYSEGFIEPNKEQQLPLLIKTNNKNNADYFAIKLAELRNLSFEYINSVDVLSGDGLNRFTKGDLVYITNFHNLKRQEKTKLIGKIGIKNVIIVSGDLNEDYEVDFPSIEIKSEMTDFSVGNIMTVEDYVKHIIVSHQDKYPDTKLSEKLGISRKSLWEKRKKYDIQKNR